MKEKGYLVFKNAFVREITVWIPTLFNILRCVTKWDTGKALSHTLNYGHHLIEKPYALAGVASWTSHPVFMEQNQ